MKAHVRFAGQFVHESERRVVDALARALPSDGIVIANLYLPDQRDALEIDVVTIGPFGVTAVEVKSWSGDVRFGPGCCYRNEEPIRDPRSSISYKAKVMKGLLHRGRPVRDVDVVANPLLVLAGTAKPVVEGTSGVAVVDLAEAVRLIASGRVGNFQQSTVLQPRDIAAVADALCERHASQHHRSVGGYRLLEPISQATDDEFPNREYWAEELATLRRVRLQQTVIDPLATESERSAQLTAARRNLSALRTLETLHLPALPLVYTTFPDPSQDHVHWTAYEGVDGPDLLDAPLGPAEKRTALAAVADTLVRCHERGVLHRALAPSCLVVPSGSRTPKLLRFDLARIEGAATLAADGVGLRIERQLRAAPELQRSARNASAASDTYAFAIVVAEVLGSQRLSTVGDARELIRHVRPKELGSVLLQALHAEPRRRPELGRIADALLGKARR